MKPALSVIFFTVASGAGLGLLVWVALADLLGATGGGTALAAVATGLVLTTLGLLSSTLHLANRKNAWRAFSQFRRSWLSREAVAAVALYPIAGLHAFALWNDVPGLRAVAALATALVALAVIHCTGMIYACLKTVPRWHHRLVPVAYHAQGLASGAVLALAVHALAGPIGRGAALVALLLLAVAAAVKLAYYAHFRAPRTHHALDTALSLPEARTRLLDVGHTHGTFLTDEFCFRLARERATRLRIAAIGCGFVLPAALVLPAAVGAGAGPALLAIAAVACLGGLLAERWLFFAEAEHVVRLYHGAARV